MPQGPYYTQQPQVVQRPNYIVTPQYGYNPNMRPPQPPPFGYGYNTPPPIVQRQPVMQPRAYQQPVQQQPPPPRPAAPQRIMNPAKPSPIRKVYLQKTTKNKSFLDMHHYLKSIGIKNNAFMLTLIDPDLDGIDPHDPHLNAYYKQKVLRECICNYW